MAICFLADRRSRFGPTSMLFHSGLEELGHRQYPSWKLAVAARAAAMATRFAHFLSHSWLRTAIGVAGGSGFGSAVEPADQPGAGGREVVGLDPPRAPVLHWPRVDWEPALPPPWEPRPARFPRPPFLASADPPGWPGSPPQSTLSGKPDSRDDPRGERRSVPCLWCRPVGRAGPGTSLPVQHRLNVDLRARGRHHHKVVLVLLRDEGQQGFPFTRLHGRLRQGPIPLALTVREYAP